MTTSNRTRKRHVAATVRCEHRVEPVHSGDYRSALDCYLDRCRTREHLTTLRTAVCNEPLASAERIAARVLLRPRSGVWVVLRDPGVRLERRGVELGLV